MTKSWVCLQFDLDVKLRLSSPASASFRLLKCRLQDIGFIFFRWELLHTWDLHKSYTCTSVHQLLCKSQRWCRHKPWSLNLWFCITISLTCMTIPDDKLQWIKWTSSGIRDAGPLSPGVGCFFFNKTKFFVELKDHDISINFAAYLRHV